MKVTIEIASKCEPRSVIHFLTAKKLSASEIYRELSSVYSVQCMSLQMVTRWWTAYLNGRKNIQDEACHGRPTSGVSTEHVVLVKQLIEEDLRCTFDELAEKIRCKTKCNRTSIQKIINDELQLCKVSARWMPRLLTQKHKTQQLKAAHVFLSTYEEEGESQLHRIVTSDETWVYYYTPESKR